MSLLLKNRQVVVIGVTLVLILAVLIVGRSTLTVTNPVLLVLGALVLLSLVLTHPVLGIILLLVSLWLTPFYPESGGLTLNRMLGLIVLAGIVVPKVNQSRKTFVFTTFDFAFLALLVVMLFSVWIMLPSAYDNDRFIDTIMSYLLFWQIINVVDSWTKLRGILGASATCAVGVSIALIQQGIESQGSTVRIALEGGSPNTYAGLFLVGTILLFWLADHTSGIAKAVLYSVVLLPVTGIFFTGNRSSIIGLGFAIIAYTLFSRRVNQKVWNIVIVSAILAGAFYFVTLFTPALAERSLDFAGESAITTDNEVRMRLLDYGLRVFAEHPLLGVGFGNGPDALARYAGDSLSVHNLFLGVAIETGIVGIVIFLFMYYLVLKDLYAIWSSGKSTSAEPVHALGKRDAFHAMVLIITCNIIPYLTHGLSPSRSWFATFAFTVVTIRVLALKQMTETTSAGSGAGHKLPSWYSRKFLNRWSVTEP